MANTQTLIAEVYSAFNQRNIDAALALTSESVSWPKASEGGRVDDCPLFLLNGNAYSATIQSAHQLTEPNVQCFWRLLQAPSLPLSGVAPLQCPNVLLVSQSNPTQAA